MARRQDVIVLLDTARDLRSQLNPDGTVKGMYSGERVRFIGWPNPDDPLPGTDATWGDLTWGDLTWGEAENVAIQGGG